MTYKAVMISFKALHKTQLMFQAKILLYIEMVSRRRLTLGTRRESKNIYNVKMVSNSYIYLLLHFVDQAYTKWYEV